MERKELKKHYTKREMEKILKKNGWEIVRYKGSHAIYHNDKGQHLSIGRCNYNAIIFQRLIKQYDMVI